MRTAASKTPTSGRLRSRRPTGNERPGGGPAATDAVRNRSPASPVRGPSIRRSGTFSFDESTGTFVGFRVEEQLTRDRFDDRCRSHTRVSGTMTIDGTTVTAVSIEANMDEIVTNDSRRDTMHDTRSTRTSSRRRRSCSPSRSSSATRPPTASRSGDGDRRSHDPRHHEPVEIPLEAQLVDGVVVVVGSLDVVFADYGVSVPDAPIVVSAEDHGIIELQLFFTG